MGTAASMSMKKTSTPPPTIKVVEDEKKLSLPAASITAAAEATAAEQQDTVGGLGGGGLGSPRNPGECFDPIEFISNGQSIVKEGTIWKLNLDCDPEAEDQWMQRRMWLTDSGGLFYYSQQFGRPVGRSVASLRIKTQEKEILGRMVFELQTVDNDVLALSPTLLAVSSASERDEWVKALEAVSSQVDQAGSNGEVDPLEPMAGQRSTDRRRLSRVHTNLSHLSGTVNTSSSMHRSESKTSYNSTLRASLTQRLMTTPLGSQRPSMSVQSAASLGPSAFGTGSERAGAHVGPPSATRNSGVRRDSQADYANKRNTAIILDWDDTLFPTTFIRTDCSLDWRRPMHEQVTGAGLLELESSLATLSEKVETFLGLAALSAKVVVVTLAKRPWVQTSSKNFMPNLAPLLERLGVEVIYAREKLTPEMRLAYKKTSFKSSEQEADFWMKAKASAMLEQLQLHYGNEVSWKNVISIGDSNFERLAVMTTTADYMAQDRADAREVKETGLTSELVSHCGHRKRLRTKAVKLLDEPAVEEMIAQVTILTQWLPHVIARDGGLDLAFEDSWDDARLVDLHKDVTGETDPTLTWKALAGLDASWPDGTGSPTSTASPRS